MTRESKRRQLPRLPSDRSPSLPERGRLDRGRAVREDNGAEPDFDHMTRRLLFREPKAGEIPGQGTSASSQAVRHVKTKVTMNLDGDVVSYFKQQSESAGLPYQTLINQVLRDHIQGSRPERLAEQAGKILADDRSFLELLAKQLADMKRA